MYSVFRQGWSGVAAELAELALVNQVNDVTNDQLPISITPEPIDRFFSDLKTRSLRSYIFLSILRAQKFRLKDFELLSCNGLKTSLSNDSVLAQLSKKQILLFQQFKMYIRIEQQLH